MELLEAAPRVETVPSTPELFQAGYNLIRERADEEWSLTDCTSFVVMAELGITEALTADHFTQAGFRPLLAPDP